MGWSSIADIGAVIFKWWTPAKVNQRARNKIDKLKRRERDLLKGKSTPKSANRLLSVRRDISRLQNYLKNG